MLVELMRMTYGMIIGNCVVSTFPCGGRPNQIRSAEINCINKHEWAQRYYENIVNRVSSSLASKVCTISERQN